MTTPNYFYVFLRKDMFPFGEENPAYLIIQSTHAAFEIAHRLPQPERGAPPAHMCLFEVADEHELFETYRYLKFNGLMEESDFHIFFEPDHDTGFSAICTRPFEGRNPLFRNFRLFGAPEGTGQEALPDFK